MTDHLKRLKEIACAALEGRLRRIHEEHRSDHHPAMPLLPCESAQIMAVLRTYPTLIEAVEKMRAALEFYADSKGESWAACKPNDTRDTCCHMISEISGGDNARQTLTETDVLLAKLGAGE